MTSENTITVNSGGSINIDMSGSAFAGTINLNGADATGSGYHLEVLDGATCILKGKTRNRLAKLTALVNSGAGSFTVDDATGWAANDVLILGATDGYNNTTPKITIVTVHTVNTGTGVVTLGGGDVTDYNHSAECRVGNFTSNLTIQSALAGRPSTVFLFQTSTTSQTREINNVAFWNMGYSSQTSRNATLFIFGASGITTPIPTISNNAFYLCDGRPVIQYRLMRANVPKTDNIIYATGSSGSRYGSNTSQSFYIGDEVDLGIFRGTLSTTVAASTFGAEESNGRVTLTTPYVASCGAGYLQTTNTEINGGIFDSNYVAIRVAAGVIDLNDVIFNNNTSCFSWNIYGAVNATNCTFSGTQNINEAATFATALPTSTVTLINKNADVTLQEIYTPVSETKRINATNLNRSTSSIGIYPTVINTDCQRELLIPCADGASIRVVGYIKKSHATNVSATVALSGLGSAWGGFTKANDTNFEVWDTGIVTNSSGNDGNFTLTYTANSSSGTTNVVYFDGVPDTPFITKCRHFGFTYDEGSPNRTVNTAVTVSAADPAEPTTTELATAEAAALLLGDTEITVTAATSAITLNANRTFQQLYDYTQAWACTTANLAYTVPLTGAGVAGSAALFAVGDVTTTGYTLNGGGSLAMGSSTLTASLPWAYTYTGGTFSQATTVPSFSGGTLNIGAAGTYTFTQAASMTVSATPTSASNYVLSSGSFTGTLNFRNTTAYNITVEIPAGVTANSTGSPGAGTVTFVSPQIYQSVTITNLVAGSRVQIYDTTSSTELFNDVVAGTSKTWTDAVAASASRAIRIRVAHVSGTTAYDFLEANIGTCGTTSSDAAVSYLANQTLDTTYNSNAVDGSAVTGITIVEGATDRVQISIAGGSVSWASIYAYQCYWLFDATGITDDGAFIEAPDTANYILTGFKIKNTHASIPLLITGGYGVDSTGSVSALYDTTGTSIFPAPAHVVPYATGSGVTPSDVTDIAAASATASAAAIVAAAVDGTTTLAESLRLSNAVLGGKVSGASTTAETFRNLDDTKDRMVFTVDSSGNRTAVTRDLT